MILLNYASGEQQEIRANYPGFTLPVLLDYAFLLEWHAPDTIYDDSLTRVVYPGCEPDCTNGYPVILWDLENNREVTRLVTMDFFGSNPIWLPDYTHFIIAANLDPRNPRGATNEFYLVSRDGEINQLTHFMDYYTDVEIYPGMSLSPNGRYVAFWIRLQPGPYEDDRLAVLDIETGAVVNYCLPGELFRNDRGSMETGYQANGGYEPIWSPDSTQMLIVLRNPLERSIRWNVLIDLTYGMAFKMGEDVEAVGWMVSP